MIKGDIEQLDRVRKMIAHHCQEVMAMVMKEVENINPIHHHTENSYQYLARYKQMLNHRLQAEMHSKWWGRDQ